MIPSLQTDNLLQADRVYFDCVFQNKNYALFCDRNYTVGRVKDLFQSTFRSGTVTQILTATDFPLESDQSIVSLIDLGVLLNGDVINIV